DAGSRIEPFGADCHAVSPRAVRRVRIAHSRSPRTSPCGLAESLRRGRDPFVCRGQGDAHVVTGCVTVELPRPSDDAEFRESSKGIPAVLPSSRPQVETGGRMIDAEPEVLETRAQLIPARAVQLPLGEHMVGVP